MKASRLHSSLLISFAVGVSLFPCIAQAQKFPYQHKDLPIEQRVADLMGRMTLEEKVAQLQGTWQNHASLPDVPESLFFIDAKGNLLPDRVAAIFKNGLGEMSRPSENRGSPRQMAEFTNVLQKWVKENTRLGIPILFHEECLHGHVAPQGTS